MPFEFDPGKSHLFILKSNVTENRLVYLDTRLLCPTGPGNEQLGSLGEGPGHDYWLCLPGGSFAKSSFEEW